MLSRHLDGDPRAFGELMECYGHALYAYLNRSGVGPPTADDLFQETFLRVHRSAKRYDAAFSFRTWLFAIAHNLVRSHWRKQKVRRVLTDWVRPGRADRGQAPAALDPPDDKDAAERRLSARQRLRWLEQALSDLPARPRQALLMTRVEGLSLEEAAEALGAPVPTVKTWVRRARLALAEGLTRFEEGEPR